MLVLGIDPGTAITGYGLVGGERDDLSLLDYGAIRTSSDLSLSERLVIIHTELTEVIAKYKPDGAAVEKLFFSSNAQSAFSVGQARGVVLLAAAQAGLAVDEYTPLEVKQAVAGYGRASKEQIQEMVRMLLNLEEVPRPDDAADAIAVAICHFHSARLTSIIDEQS